MVRGKKDALTIEEVIADDTYLEHPTKTLKPDGACYKGGGAKIWEVIDLIKKNPRRAEIFGDTVFEPLLRVSEMKSEGLLCHMMYLHELRPNRATVEQKRMYFKFGCSIISYGPEEFSLITGLSFGKEIEPCDMFKKDMYSDFRARVFPELDDNEVTVKDLKHALLQRKIMVALSDEDAVRCALLYCLTVGFWSKEPRDKVTREWLLLVDNLVAWNSFPWGSYLFSHAFTHLQNVFGKIKAHIQSGTEQGLRYSVSGYTAPFRIWVWEMMPALYMENAAIYNQQYPRLVRWRQLKKMEWVTLLGLFDLNGSLFMHPPEMMQLEEAESVSAYFQSVVDMREQKMQVYPEALWPLIAKKHLTMPMPFPCPFPPPQRSKHAPEVDQTVPQQSPNVKPVTAEFGNLNRDGSLFEDNEITGGVGPLTDDDVWLLNQLSFTVPEDPFINEMVNEMSADDELGSIYNFVENAETIPSSVMQTGNDASTMEEKENDENILHGEQVTDERPNGEDKKEEEVFVYEAPKKLRKKGPALKSPYIVEAKKKRGITTEPQFPTSTDFSSYLLQAYAARGDRFLFSYNLDPTAIDSIKHRFEPSYALSMSFWEILMGKKEAGWLENNHINIWTGLLKEKWKVGDNWTIMSTEFFSTMENTSRWLSIMQGAAYVNDHYPRSWSLVEKVFIPIHVASLGHWILGELHLGDMKMLIYDSAERMKSLEYLLGAGIMLNFQEKLFNMLDSVGYWSRPRRTPPDLTFEKVNDLPQQAGDLGDCGVFVCMWLEQLLSGITLQIDREASKAAKQFRARMGEILLGSYDRPL